MSKVIKGALSGVVLSLALGGLVGCGSSQASKSIDKGKELINDKNYCKALLSFEMALDEDPKNEEAKNLKNMLEDYLDAEKAFKDGDLGKAEVKIESIGDENKTFKVFNESVVSLEKSIEKKAQYEKDLNSDMDKLSKLIDNKNYAEAQILCKSICGRELTNDQKEKVDKLKLRLATEIEVNKANSNKNDNNSNKEQQNLSVEKIS